MADTTKEKRKPAPTVESILMTNTDERRELIERYSKKYPDYAFKFHRMDVSDYELEKNGYEKVVVNGGVENHNGDPLVRRLKELDDGVRAARQGASYELAKKNMPQSAKRGELTQVAKPKTPVKLED